MLLWLGVEALRRQTMEEFPDAELGDPFGSIRGQADRFTGWLQARRHAHSPAAPATAAPAAATTVTMAAPASAPGPPPTGDADRLARLERLAALHNSGALTDDEYAAEKRTLLGGS